MRKRNQREIAGALRKKGFREDNRHRKFLLLYINGIKTPIRTKISHGRGEYSDNIMSQIKKQLRLASTKELDDLINCPMSEEDYIKLLFDRGVLKYSSFSSFN